MSIRYSPAHLQFLRSFVIPAQAGIQKTIDKIQTIRLFTQSAIDKHPMI